MVRAKDTRTGKKTAVLSLLYIPEKQYMVVGLENGDLTTVDLVSGHSVFSTNLGGAVLFLVHIPDGRHVLAGVSGGDLKRLDLESGRVAANAGLGVDSVQCVVRVGDKMVCAGTASGDLVELDLPGTTPGVVGDFWRRLAQGFTLHLRLGAGGGGVLSLAHSPEKQQVFAGLGNGSLVTVDLPSGKVTSSTSLAGGKVLSLVYMTEMMNILVGMENGDLIRVDPELGHTTGRFVASRLNLGVGLIKSLLHIPGRNEELSVVLAGLWSGEIVSVAKTVSY
jgi:hypothetical protein